MKIKSLQRIYGILYDCPFSDRLAACPLFCIDELSFKQKVNFIDELSVEEVDRILVNHKQCSWKRENEPSKLVFREYNYL
ncbi:hypothetical protein DF185_21945 [Marinifilum breve]|uniref:Uncharacterized protein n=1 Tax=Marinifilum breve TaxID=2184082 RepID=A0A2V3ZQF5_9BACT|nr:hypothetical protein [Marinifilum breve]PXX95383.1 hypothetical protein DF185_21945 [Marinifilum breve]